MQRPPQKPTYLFVLPWSLSHIGGVNQVVINLAREMQKANEFQPIVLINDWDATHPIWEDVQGLKTVRWRVRPYQDNVSLKEKFAYYFWGLRFSRKFHNFCNAHKVVAINAHYPGPSAFSIERIIKNFSRTIHLILSFHGSDLSAIELAGEFAVTRWRRLLSSASCSGVVVCSNGLGRQLVDVIGREVSPLVIYNGLDASAFSSMAGEPTSDSDRIILNVAKFEEKKGQDVLVKAFAEIAVKYEDVKLVFVGATDKALPSLRAFCVSKGIDKRVEFYPDTPHEQVAEFYKRATIFCLPSRKESFGIVILEAASFAVPVVASRVGGIPEVVSDGISGLLVSPDDPSELALCIMSLLDDPDAAKDMGRRLYQHVISNFSWYIAYNKYANILREHNVS